jgi:hypothetical protein
MAVHAQAVVAIVAHANVLLGDPGAVGRSRESCLPVPPVVSERLRAGDALDGLENVRDEYDGSTFCVRCCVWRRPPPPPAERADSEWTQWLWRTRPSLARAVPCAGGKPAHHCSLCRRCVKDHDRHCGVLGRCIAGKNMPWLILLLATGQLASFTVGGAVLLALHQRFGSRAIQYALYALAAWCALSLCFAALGRVCFVLRHLVNTARHEQTQRRSNADGQPAPLDASPLPTAVVQARPPHPAEDVEAYPQAAVSTLPPVATVALLRQE